MRWQYVLFLSMMGQYVGAVCPAGEQPEQICITKIDYECIRVWTGATSCWEKEISFNITDASSGDVHTSGTLENNEFDTLETTFDNACSTSFTINMADSYGDGWNGARIHIYGTINGGTETLLEGGVALNSGASGQESVPAVCDSCPTGYYKASEGFECTSCEVGQYSKDTGSTACLACTNGTPKIDMTATWTKTGSPSMSVAWKIKDILGSNDLLGPFVYSSTPRTFQMGVEPFRFYTYSSSSSDGWGDDSNGYKIEFRSTNGFIRTIKPSPGYNWRYYSHSNGIKGPTSCSCPASTMINGTACANCPAGYLSSTENAVECKRCQQGTYSAAKSTECINCPVGYDAPALYSSRCTKCAAGKFAYEVGTASCHRCYRGTYQDETTKTSCKSCPNGKVLNVLGRDAKTECQECPIGKVSNSFIKEIEFECPGGNCYKSEISWNLTSFDGTEVQSGSYSDTVISVNKYAYKIVFKDSYGDGWNGAYIMILTQRGYVNYWSPTGDISIVLESNLVGFRGQGQGSGSGTYITHLTFNDPKDNKQTKELELQFERAVCAECPGGYTSDAGSEKTCSICPAGTYREFEDAGVCKNCVAGQYSGSGASVCSTCVPGKYSSDGSGTCSNCQTGEHSPAGSDTCLDCNGYTTYNTTFTFKKFGSPSTDASWRLASTTGSTLFGPFTAPSTTTLALRSDKQYRIYRWSSEKDTGWVNDNDNRYLLSVNSTNQIFNNEEFIHFGKNWAGNSYSEWYSTRPTSGSLNSIGGDTCVCSLGFYQDDISCSACSAGTYSKSWNAPTCNPCPLGTYASVNSSGTCDICPNGTTTLQTGSSLASQCVQCSKGQYVQSGGRVSEMPIKKCIQSIQFTSTGSYTSEVKWNLISSNGDIDTGVFNTSEVIINKFYVAFELEDTYGDGWSGNKLTLKYCDGTYATTSDFISLTHVTISGDEITFDNPDDVAIKTTRLEWPAGDFEKCVTCAAGTYSDAIHASQCKQCPSRRAILDDGETVSLHDDAADCSLCPAGTEFVSSTECRQCPMGQFQPYSGLAFVECTTCPFGKTTRTEGATECEGFKKQVFTGIFRACLLEDNEFICWGRDDIPMKIGYKRQGPNALTGHIFCPTPLKNNYSCPSWYGMDFYWDYFDRPDNNVYDVIRAYMSAESKQIDNIYLLGPITCVLFRDNEFNCWSKYQYTKTLHLEGVQSVSVKQKRDNYVYNGKEHAGGTQNTWGQQQSANSRYGKWRAWDFKHILCVIIDYTPSCYDLRALYAQETNLFNYMVTRLTPAEMPTWPTYNQNLIEAEDYVRGDTFEPVKGIVSLDIKTSSWVSWWGTYYEPKKTESTCTEGYTELQCCYEYIDQIGWSSGSYVKRGYRDWWGRSLRVQDWGEVMPYGCFLALDIYGRVIGGGRSYFNTNLLSYDLDDSIWQAKRWTSAGGRDQQYESKQDEMLGSLQNWDLRWPTPTYSFVYGRPWQTSEKTTYTTPYQDASAQKMYGDCVQRTYSRITCIDGIDIKGEIVGFSPNEDNRVVYYQNMSDNTIGYIYDGNIFKSNVTVKGTVSVGMFEACSIGRDDDKVICWTNPNIDLTFVSMYDREETWTFTDISNPILNEPPTPYIFLGSGKCMDKTNEQEYQLSGSAADPIEECMNGCEEKSLAGGFYMNTARNKCYCVQENCVPLGRRLYIPIGVGLDVCQDQASCELKPKLSENRQWDSYVKRVITLNYTTKTDMYWQPHSPSEFEYPSDMCEDDDKDGVCNEDEVVGCTRPISCTWQKHFTESAPKGHFDECGYPFDNVNYECHPTERGKYRFDELSDTWIRNPGLCTHSGGDDDENGWCDQLDEIIGCLDVRACNYDGCLDTDICPRITGDLCDVNSDCMSQQCTWCNGAFRCTLPPQLPGDRPTCNRDSVTNMDYVTRHNKNFCRMPYGRSFKCTVFNRQFSSMKGVPIENAGNKTYLKMTPENRKKMIRCLNVDDRCDSIDEFTCQSNSDTGFYPRNVCCQCGGGRVFDTSPGEPLFDKDSNGIPDERQAASCNDPKACNFDPTALSFSSNTTCKYNDVDQDGLCDDLYDAYTPRCGVFGANNYVETLTKTEIYDKSVCEYPSNNQICLARPYYKTVFGCTDKFACDYNFAATQNTGKCTYIEPRKTCQGDTYRITGQCFMAENELINGNIGTCVGIHFEGETCVPECDYGYMASAQNRICQDGMFSPFYCEISDKCIEPNTGQYVVSPCTFNESTIISNCSEPSYGQFILTPCISGNMISKGMNANIKNCSTPEPGQYIETPCTTNSDAIIATVSVCTQPLHNQWVETPCTTNSDAVIKNCSSPNFGEYVSKICTTTNDTTIENCSTSSKHYPITNKCISGNYSYAGQNAHINTCGELFKLFKKEHRQHVNCNLHIFHIKMLWNTYC